MKNERKCLYYFQRVGYSDELKKIASENGELILA